MFVLVVVVVLEGCVGLWEGLEDEGEESLVVWVVLEVGEGGERVAA